MSRETLTLGFMGTILSFVMILAVIAISFPLVVFGVETYDNPNIIQLKASATPINASYMNATIVVIYDGSIPLKNFSLKINNTWYNIGTVHRGETMYSIIIEARPVKVTAYSFSIAGIYPVKIEAGENG